MLTLNEMNRDNLFQLGQSPTIGVMQTSGIGPGDGAGVEVAPTVVPPGGPSPSPQGSPFGMLWIVVVMFAVIMLFSFGGNRKEKKQRQQLLSSLGKHDVVQTASGIIGTISEIRDNEVVLKIDEAGTSKVRFTKSSILHVVRSHSNKQADAEKVAEVATAL